MTAKKKILIVDDEEIVTKGIKKGLDHHGFNVKTATSGKEAIKLAKKEFFDVVILDLIMPEMDGVDTCREIKKISPQTEVVLLSGYPREIENSQISFIKAGGRDLFLRKPLMVDEVKEAIEKILD